MKGCLTFIIKTIIAILVFFGLVHLGVIDFVKDKINEYNSQNKEEITEKVKDVADLSQISDEYTIEKNIRVLKNKMIFAEHKATDQKMIIIEPVKNDLVTQKDIEDDGLQTKLEDIANKYKYKLVKTDKIEVSEKGKLKGFNQEIPYAKINIEISNLPIKHIEGIIGVAEREGGKNLIIFSVNEKGKYSQIITEAFYSKVK